MRVPITIVGLALIIGAFVPPASAQSSNCDYSYTYQTYENIPLIPGSQCVPSPPYALLCVVKKSICTPAAAPDETSCKSCAAAGKPINLSTGNTYITETDFAIPGLNGGLGLKRTWNSKWPASQAAIKPGIFGSNWRSTYEERIFFGQDGYLKYGRGDGSFWSFGYDTAAAKSVIIAPADAAGTLTLANSLYTLTFKDGTKRTFDGTSGWLKSIVDRNGNTTTIAYDAQGRLSTVTDPASRTITFNYPNSTSLLVSSVVSNAGTITYRYDAQNRLDKVTNPDNTFTTFEYDAQGLIAAVKDTDGKLLEGHTYDAQGRGLTSTRANGVDWLSISYPPDPSGVTPSNPQ